METNNYYTPTIEEFHVGFEYERLLHDIFIGLICDTNDIETIEVLLGENPGEIRVKYLDKVDFAELGFIHKEDQGMSENGGFIYTIPDPHFQKADIMVRYWVSTGSYRLRIDRINGCIFDGTIKNKSELKRLIKQLGIEQVL